jgi:hypothetical protein
LSGLVPGLPGLPPCPLRSLTGIPCPGCFLTRATSAALAGDLQGSIELHAFGPPVAAGLLVWSLLAIRRRRLLPRQMGGLSLGLGVVVLILYWLLRLWLSFGIGMRGFPAFSQLS